jgi:uncharacterized protein YxjI
MQYPLTFRFKLFALASQIFVTDAAGQSVCYVKQKMFKLKEAVNVFTDESQQNLLCRISADRILDFSAFYRFTDAAGESFGGIRRKGMRSIFKAHYEILENDQVEMTLQEENGWVKVIDSLVGEIPLVGMFSGLMFNPTYLITHKSGQPVLRLKKQPAMWEGKFELEKLSDMDPGDELRALMGVLMMALLERKRG